MQIEYTQRLLEDRKGDSNCWKYLENCTKRKVIIKFSILSDFAFASNIQMKYLNHKICEFNFSQQIRVPFILDLYFNNI